MIGKIVTESVDRQPFSFSDCIGISGEIEDFKWICRIVSSSGNEVEIVSSSWGQEKC